MTKFIEYRVRPVTRFIVTRFWREDDPANAGAGLASDSGPSGSSQHGEFDNHTTAYAVGYALCKQEHERLGWPVGDERIKYPDPGPWPPAPGDDPHDAVMAEAMERKPAG